MLNWGSEDEKHVIVNLKKGDPFLKISGKLCPIVTWTAEFLKNKLWNGVREFLSNVKDAAFSNTPRAYNNIF
jgi:hypothetical protein